MNSIRRVNPKEADTLTHIAISAKRHWGYPEHWLEIWAPQLTFSPEYFDENESWVAEIDNNLVGFYTLQEEDGIAWIENLWVLPEYIGRGIGKQLFVNAVSRSRELGYKVLQLEADPNAIKFYEKMGMYKIGERHSEIEDEPRILPILEMIL